MTFDRIATCCGRVVSSRAVWTAGATVAIALTFGASDSALAQCVGAFASSSGSGIHSTPSPNAGVHSATSAPSAHSASSSCSTVGSATNTHAVRVNMGRLNPAIGRPAVGGADRVAATQHGNTHAVRSNPMVVKR